MIVITGGSGFIGTHLCRRLSAIGYDVRVVDILPPKAQGVEYVCASVLEELRLKKIFSGADAVIHLAALVDVASSTIDPRSDFLVNAEGTLNVLEAARKVNTKVLYASSAAVYGEPIKVPIDEMHPTVPLSPYGASKLAAERYVLLYKSLYGMENVALRLFNVYGEGQTMAYAGVIAKFKSAIAKGEHPIIYGTGEQTRDFVHVDDVCTAFIRALDSRGCSTPINIASGVETSMNNLLRLMSNTSPIYLPERKGEIARSVADIRLARKEIGYVPAISLSF